MSSANLFLFVSVLVAFACGSPSGVPMTRATEGSASQPTEQESEVEASHSEAPSEPTSSEPTSSDRPAAFEPRVLVESELLRASIEVNDEGQPQFELQIRGAIYTRPFYGPNRTPALETTTIGDWVFVQVRGLLQEAMLFFQQTEGAEIELGYDETVYGTFAGSASATVGLDDDGEVRVSVSSTQSEACVPSRRELQRARQELSDESADSASATLQSIQRRAVSWSRQRPAVSHLALRDRALSPAPVPFETVGDFGPCTGHFLPVGPNVLFHGATEEVAMEHVSDDVHQIDVPRSAMNGSVFEALLREGQVPVGIDAVRLRVGELWLHPSGCANAPGLAPCDADRVVLGGEATRFHFEIPAHVGTDVTMTLEVRAREADTPEVSAPDTFDEDAAELVYNENGVRVLWETGDQQRARVFWRDGVATSEPAMEAFGRYIEVREVRIERGVTGLFVALSFSGDEDENWNRNVLLIHDGQGTRQVRDSATTSFSNTYDNTALFPGDGTVRIRRQASSECSPTRPDLRAIRRDGFSPSESLDDIATEFDFWVRYREVERILEIVDDQFVHAIPRVRNIGRWGRCEGRIFSACPYVDILDDDGTAERIGEILRSVEHAPLTQPLAVPRVEGPVLRIRISEEKDERTFLDAIEFQSAGGAVRPRSCDESPSAAYCEIDGNYVVLDRGDALELEFDLGALSVDSAGVLSATGYYESY